MKSTTTTTRKSRSKTASLAQANPESFAPHTDRLAHIAVSAYYKAEARGFAPGGELDDWLQAEAELGANSAAL